MLAPCRDVVWSYAMQYRANISIHDIVPFVQEGHRRVHEPNDECLLSHISHPQDAAWQAAASSAAEPER
jgi:hypothetical protein